MKQGGQKEEDFQFSRNLLETILNNSPAVVFLKDVDGRYIFLNRKYEELFHVAQAAFIGKKDTDLFPPEAARVFRKNDLEVIAAKRPLEFEEIVPQDDGIHTYISVKFPLFDPKGVLYGVCGIATDITRRKKIEEENRKFKEELEGRVQERTAELSRAASLLHATLESTADGILVVNREGKIVSFNRKFVEMWRIPRDIIDSRDDDRAIQFVLEQLKDPDTFLKRISYLYKNADEESYDVLPFKDGRIFERYSFPQRLGHAVMGRVWSFRDVTDRRNAEEALEKSEKKYRYLVETSQDLIWSIDVNGRITYMNANGARKIYGYEVEELLGRLSTSLVSPAYLEKDRQAFRQVRDGETIFHYETVHLRKDGRPVNLIFNAIVLRDERGAIIGMTGTGSDITHLKKVEEQLRQANEGLRKLSQIKSDFASMLSHELRTPLGVINESLNVVCEGIDGPVNPEQVNTLSVAQTNVQRLARLIDNILDLSKLEAGKMRMIFAPTPIRLLVDNVCVQMKPLCRKKRLEGVCELPPAEKTIVCDADKIRQVLVNLIDNAIKYTPQGGSMKVRLDYDNNDVVLTVEDSGMGVRKQDSDKIFEMFGRTLQAEIKAVDGFGIGLAVCKYIVDRHRGKIEVSSKEGKGSRFIVRLPVNLPPHPAVSSDSETSGSFG